MLEDVLFTKYAKHGRNTSFGELYLPFFAGEQFINECAHLQVTIIGVDFFLRWP